MADFVKGDDSEVLDDLVQTLSQSLCDHPGFMWTASGFEVLHADWPTYPRGHGTRITLHVLSEFPPETPLYRIDSIDRCSLFVVARERDKNPFSPQHHHLAFWDEDLAHCARQGFVNGVSADGDCLELIKPFVNLTPIGAHAALINELVSAVDEELLPGVIDHLYMYNYDTAVRESALRVEVDMKNTIESGTSKTKLIGQSLIEVCLADDGPLVSPSLPNAHRAAIRSAFRSYFAYVRNEYAHNIPATDLLTACRLVRRSSALLRCIQVLRRAKRGG